MAFKRQNTAQWKKKIVFNMTMTILTAFDEPQLPGGPCIPARSRFGLTAASLYRISFASSDS